MLRQSFDLPRLGSECFLWQSCTSLPLNGGMSVASDVKRCARHTSASLFAESRPAVACGSAVWLCLLLRWWVVDGSGIRREEEIACDALPKEQRTEPVRRPNPFQSYSFPPTAFLTPLFETIFIYSLLFLNVGSFSLSLSYTFLSSFLLSSSSGSVRSIRILMFVQLPATLLETNILRHSWSPEDEANWQSWSWLFLLHHWQVHTFVFYWRISTTTARIGIKFAAYIHSVLRMNPNEFCDFLTFHSSFMHRKISTGSTGWTGTKSCSPQDEF